MHAYMEYQLKHLAIPLFEARWPEHQAVFFFDNATNHTAFAAGALRVSSMNLSPGGNQNHNMRDGWCYTSLGGYLSSLTPQGVCA